MTSTDKINQLFWLNYAQAIKDAAKANFGPEQAFFIGSETQTGPIAGDNIPDEYTNQGLYDVANNLLAADNLFYTPSALHGYTEALDTYLNWVELGGKKDLNLDNAMLNALKDQKAAQTYYNTQQDVAYERFTKDQKRGLTNGQDFYSWIALGRAPDYTQASDNLTRIGSQIASIQGQINGPMSVTVNNDRAKLKQGLDTTRDNPGYNMHGAMGDVQTPAELTRAEQSGTKVPPPAFQRLPAYSAPLYKTFIQGNQVAPGQAYNPKNSIEISVNTKDETSKFNFGQTTGGASVGFSYGGWFSFNAGAEHSTTSSSLDTGSETSSVKVKLLYDNMQTITISPGSWNVDISKYKLRNDAPKDVKTLVRPAQLLVVSQLGLEITVSDSLANSLDTKLQQTTKAGGGLRIFGIPIGLSASGSKTTETDTHQAHWDGASKTLRVLPAQNYGTATVLGVIGEKFQIL